MLVHASCVAIGEIGVLLRGASGSGKSGLCLQLIDAQGFGLGAQALRAELVADDQVELTRQGEALLACAPASLAGKLEIRGLGIVSLPYRKQVRLRLVVELLAAKAIERMPEEGQQSTVLADLSFPSFSLDASAPTAPARLRAGLHHFGLI